MKCPDCSKNGVEVYTRFQHCITQGTEMVIVWKCHKCNQFFEKHHVHPEPTIRGRDWTDNDSLGG